MRTKLNTEILPQVPDIIANRIAMAIKTQKSIDKTGANYNQITHDTLWIPDVKDMGFLKAKYGKLYSDKTSMLKYKVNNGETIGAWWLRGTSNYNNGYNYMFDNIGLDIANSSASTDGEKGVCLCFCMDGPKEIQDSWEEIFASQDDGTYETKYRVEDYKPLNLGKAGVVNLQLSAINYGDISDGSGTAKVYWIAMGVLPAAYDCVYNIESAWNSET